MQKSSNSKQNAAQQQQNQAGFEKTIQFSQSQAIVWQIKFLLNQITNKKALAAATNELENLSKQFGKGFDKYLLRELIEQLDLKDPVKAQLDKNDQFRVQLLNQEIVKSASRHEFLQYFGEISQQIFGDRVSEFLTELTKRLRLNFPTQLLIALSIYESSREDFEGEALKLLKQKLVDYHTYGKPEQLPEYAVHRLMYHLSTCPEFSQDQSMKDIQQYIKDSNPLKAGSHISLRSAITSNLIHSNTSQDDPSISLIKDGVGLDNIDKSYKILEPWQVLIEIGHYCTYNYSYLLKVLEEFKEMNELRMAKTLLHLSQNHVGTEDQLTRIVYSTYEACKKGDSSGLNKEPNDKKTSMTWSIDNLARAFRELYSNLNWLKVFEALTEVQEKENINLDYKAFQMFLQLYNKCKPQNVMFPLNVVLNHEWSNTLLHISFIEYSIQSYVDKKDKSINFSKLEKKQELIDELSSVKEKVPIEHINVWLSIDLVEKLITLSDSHYFTKVRQIFDYPMKHLPEYLILTLSHCKPKTGSLMIDELLSLLLPQFLGNHINSIPVLQNLWKNNQALIIRGICELCRHDQRIMNLSRVLDITQEVRESLMPIVNCDDYYFAVNLGILAGKRDFLHYDQWLVDRIKNIGTPFIKALLKYMKEHILTPIQEFIRSKSPTANIQDVNTDQLENQKVQILDRSHLSREKLCMTIEHLSSLQNRTNPKIQEQTLTQIQEFITKISEYYPNQFINPQNSEEIDNAANDYFQRVFQAEAWQVDQKIQELIETMKKFKESDVKKEQEIYACILHSLFDEYKFLHRYPQQYLEKIAKIYGAIIKNKIIDGTLQDIALKFAFEAFRREGKRQKFGVITIRQFFDMLPQFPTFFEEIYENRQSIAQTDPQMVKDIEELYERSQKRSEETKTQPQVSVQPVEETKKLTDTEEAKLKKAQEDKKETTDKKKDSKAAQFQQPANLNVNEFTPQQKVTQESKKTQQQNVQEEQKAKVQQTIQGTDQSLQRTTTPLGSKPAQVFIPSYKQSQKLEPTKSVPNPTENSNLNIQSVEFKRVTPNQEGIAAQSQLGASQSLNTNVPTFNNQAFQNASNQQLGAGSLSMLNSNAFKPMNVRSPPPQTTTTVNQQLVQMQQQIDQRMQKAINENAKVRLEDIIEDPNIQTPKEEIKEQIKFICNNIGKTNFTQKLEDLKAAIFTDSQVNLKWLIHYILIRRIQQATNLHALYIEMIKQLNLKESIGIAINQAVDLFKKCLLIDQEKFLQVIQRTQHSGSIIRQYIMTLGSFLGGLTVAGNRPIFAKELDLKKLLVEAYFTEKLDLVVLFVCKIFKECAKSSVFKPVNPWIKANLEVLREIYEMQIQNIGNQKNDMMREIDSMLIIMGITNMSEVKNTGFLKAAITKQFISQSQHIEYTHLMNKTSLVPPPPSAMFSQQQVPLRNQSVSPSPNLFMPTGGIFPNGQLSSNVDINVNQPQLQEIASKVQISPELMQHFSWLPDCENKLKTIVSKAVDSSIVEILPPVVDRSVTIALITTRELVLKDFAFDSDTQKIHRAADLIVQNLAGSLALVTCREPLKMSLTTNLKKAIQQLISEANPEQTDQMNENFISDISAIASRENLELGCKLINKSVVQKALTRVREDLQIRQAVERRNQSQGRAGPYLLDENMAQQFAELPPQLKPNPMGLTESQFQVYEDFQRQGRSSRRTDQEGNRANQINEQNANDIDSLLRQIERIPTLNEVLKYQLSQKLAQLQNEQDQEEVQKLWLFCQRMLISCCDKFIATNDIDQVSNQIEVLGYIAKNFKVEDFQKQLTKVFLETNDVYANNISLTVILMKNSIISIPEWDLNISIHLREYMQFQQPDVFMSFIINFIQQTIISEKIFNQGQFPNMMSVIDKLSEQQSLSQVLSPLVETLKSKLVWNKEKLKGYILQWAQISFEENNKKQEQEVNKFFHNLSEIGFYKDSDIMYNFCKVMVEISIERALYMQNGTKRPIDRLDYRYIESFLKLMVVLLKTSEINKHEFMSKLFEAIQEVLDEDHKSKKTDFNQKPYYRLLINILTAVNNLQFINPKTHLLILFSLADLFSKLNPNKYPAFSFAWLELISHKQFMPHFLAFQNNQPLEQYMNNLYQSIGPQNRGQAQATSQQAADNTFYQKWFKFKELIVNLFTFLKNNMIPSQQLSGPLVKYYEATLRVVLVIRHDFPEFLCDFYFNFVNSLPEHCIQLRNIILSANPKSVPYHNPFGKNLKVDQIKEIYNKPRMLSMSYDSQTQSVYDNQDAGFNDHQVYLNIMNLREDLEKYFRTKSPSLITVICEKMMQSEEIINGRRKINSNIINAVVLFIGNHTIQKVSQDFKERECYEMYKKIITCLNNETRSCFLNCLVNELRYINSQTYFFSWIVLFLFSDIDDKIQEQITRILIERLQVHEPYPWGLCITFRELLQNPKYNFLKKSFVVQNMDMFEQLFQTRLQPLLPTWQNKKISDQILMTQDPQQQLQLQQQQQQLNANQQ